jgi:phosphatidylserine/phosphatidylglycerophosphate/cardiolipin synthase-like enzyme
MTRTGWRVALILGTILAILLLTWFIVAVASEVRENQEPPVDANGSITVVMCPDCEQAFNDLLASGSSVQCALYDVGKETAAVLANVDADVITDDETNAAYGEPVLGAALMHHKFCVINGSIVTSGSYNPTDGGSTNRNNLVIVSSPTLAHNYGAQFESVRDQRREGAREPLVYLGSSSTEGVRVENYFCPADDCEDKVIRALDSAVTSIDFMVFSFTSDAVGDALLRAQERGVAVEGFCDGGQSRSERDYNECARVGAQLWEEAGLLHHKVFIIDGETVVTGSYNPTASGTTRNNENVLIVTDETFAAAYAQEYAAVRSTVQR